MELFWELWQDRRISAAQGDASVAKVNVAQNTREVRDLDFTIDRIALASQAMWELLSARLGLTEEDLRAKMAEIDLRDGKEDGRMTTRATDCTGCGRKVNVRRERCLYCGATVTKPMAFQ